MKTLWRSVLVCTGVLLAIAIPAYSKTANQITNPSLPTDAPSNENVIGMQESPEYQTAYQNGRREAEESIAIGKPTIYTAGLWRPDGSTVDPETGFPFVSIAGCIVNDSIIGRMNGYNDRIREWVAQQSQGVESSRLPE